MCAPSRRYCHPFAEKKVTAIAGLAEDVCELLISKVWASRGVPFRHEFISSFRGSRTSLCAKHILAYAQRAGHMEGRRGAQEAGGGSWRDGGPPDGILAYTKRGLTEGG